MSFILEQFHLFMCHFYAKLTIPFWRYKIHYLNYFHEFVTCMQMFKFELCDDVPCATGEIGDRISTVVVVSSIQHKIKNRK